ncbi:hypothetical protein NP233_g6434 [Leucocoprinus birnbaumii]|uniref:C3H1-type domain-containing protein n=1 Tax=Leucocoprinus birnbaumii TaxID=56174 RepID=A0AAD5YVJ4_9AGAR|nr:hypothetical protein NP233_g6434 [Leucocoprinus birnbaumii]
MDSNTPVRCKFFDDDGNPVDGGCRFGGRCRYIHPDHIIWKDTKPYGGRSSHDRSKGQWPSRRNDTGSSSRGNRDKGHDRKRSSGGSWSTEPSFFGSTLSTPKAVESTVPGQGTWGSANTTADTAVQDFTAASSGWGSSTGWGDTTQADENPWGGGSSDWGNSGWGDGGWGNSASGQSSESTAQQNKTVKTKELSSALASSQSAPDSPSMLFNNPAISRLPRSHDQADILPRPQPTKAMTSDTLKSTVASTIPQDTEMVEGPSSTPVISAKRPRLPLPTRSQRRIQSTPTLGHSEGADDKRPPPSPVVPQDWSKVPLPASVAGRVQQDEVASEASGPVSALVHLSPDELHSKVIKEMMHAVLIRYDLLKAEERKDKWRRARGSFCYQHSTPAAQKILDSTNTKFSEELNRLNKKLSAALKKIVRYSDALIAHRDLLEKGLDTKKILMYTDELRDWVSDLDLRKRVFAASTIIEGERRGRETIKRQRREEVTTLKDAVYELELTLTDISDDLVCMQYDQPEKFRELCQDTEKAMDKEGSAPNLECLFSQLGIGSDTVAAIKEQVTTTNQQVLNHIPRVEELRAQVKALEEEVEDLRQKENEATAFREEAASQLKQMEIWQKADKARLDQLSNKIEALHQQPNPSPQIDQPLAPCKVDDLLPYTEALVNDYVTQEIKPALDAIVEAANKSSHSLTSQFDQLVERVVKRTYDLVQITFKANGFVPQLQSTST